MHPAHRRRGDLFIEGRTIRMEPPWIVWLPVGVVHGFRFIPGTEGLVLTVSHDVVDAATSAVRTVVAWPMSHPSRAIRPCLRPARSASMSPES